MPSLYEIFLVLITAGFKYMVAVMMSFGFDLGFWSSLIICSTGGVVGVLTFILFGGLIKKSYRKFFKKPVPYKTPINRRSRYIVYIKRNHGLAGIAFLTPVFLTVPIGTFAAIAIGYPWKKIMLYMLVAFIGWSLFFFGLYEISGFNISEWLKDLFN